MDLGEFEGHPILRSQVKITRAGDSLSPALKIEPVALHHDERTWIVLEGRIVDVQHPGVPDTNGVARTHVFRTEAATLVDGALVAEVMAAQAEKIRVAKEEAAGITRLPYSDEPDLIEAHNAGEHADGLVGGCPECDAELQSIEDEAAGNLGMKPKPARKRRSS